MWPLLTLMMVAMVSGTNSNIRVRLCRPDHFYADGKCIPLQRTLSDTIGDILENSEPALAFLNSNNETSVVMPRKVPVSDLFVQNLAVISEANMSECLSLAACTEQCLSWPTRSFKSRKHEEDVVERFLSSTELNDSDDESGGSVDFVRIIMQGAQKGIQVAKQPKMRCNQCEVTYPNCTPLQYNYTTRINAIYRNMIESNVTLTDGSSSQHNRTAAPETIYYHYTMQFLDVANLTTCYALVSCETTCDLYRMAIQEKNGDLLSSPPPVVSTVTIDNRNPNAANMLNNAAQLGYRLALADDCIQCPKLIRHCTPDKYVIAKASSELFNN